MNNFWLNRAEERAMTMERKIEKMLAPHHVIWLGDDTVGRDAKPMPTSTLMGSNASIPSEIKLDWGTVPSQITINCPTQMAEWDSHTIMTPPTQCLGDSCCCFDINALPTNIEAQISKCLLENDFIISVESEGWNLDL